MNHITERFTFSHMGYPIFKWVQRSSFRQALVRISSSIQFRHCVIHSRVKLCRLTALLIVA
jgi:hypothetical protein